MTKSLVHLASEVSTLEQALLENDGVLPPELEAMFDLTTGDLRNKVDRYKYMIDALTARAEYFKKMEQDIYQAKKTFENQVERLRDRLKYVMNESGESEIVGNDWRFKLSKTKDKLYIDPESGPIPEEYMKDEVKRVPDKDAIMTALKMGWDVPGVELVESQSMRCYVNAEGRAKPVKEIKE